ncbi:MAG: hypothetical protein GY719_39145 [bacterium]|nr:hypothetical protein [bacterium]
MTLEQIRRKGLEALVRELGPAGMARFLQQFESGRGDYTAEREQWLGDDDVKTLAAKILEERQAETP